MPKTPFGENLRREREMRGVSLEEISNATRIGTRFLQALENDDWESLPGGVFRRGFIRAVARYLGLNEDTLLAEYSLATNDKPDVAVWADGPEYRAPQRSFFRPLLFALLFVALSAGGWFAWQEYSPLVRAWRSPEPPAPQVALLHAPPPPPDSSATTGSENPSVTAAGNSSAKIPAQLDLKISVGSPTSVSVFSDGKNVYEGRMTTNENKLFHAKESFEISASNSTAVLLEMNGQTMPPIGSPGQPGKLTLTRADLKKQAGGTNQ